MLIETMPHIFLFPQLAGLIFFGFHFLFFPTYIVCIIIFIIIGLSDYKRIFIFDVIGALITVVYLTLNLTGFCYKEFKYLSKQEIVDVAFERTLEACNKYNDACPSYQEIKQQYPQCFGENMSDSCIDMHETKAYTRTVYKIEKEYSLLPPIVFIPIPLSCGVGFHVYSDLVESPIKYQSRYKGKYADIDDPGYISVSSCGQ
jgi:hypothetical protein